MTSVVYLVHLHAQVVLTVAIAFIVEAFVHKYHLAQFTTEKGTYVRIYIISIIHNNMYVKTSCTNETHTFSI